MGCCLKWFCSEKSETWLNKSRDYYEFASSSGSTITPPNEGFGKFTTNIPSTKGKLYRTLYFNEK